MQPKSLIRCSEGRIVRQYRAACSHFSPTSRRNPIVFRALQISIAINLVFSLVLADELFANERMVFFETKIRPALIKHCYPCHSSEAESVGGKLLLDSRDALREGGESGSVIVAGDPDSSLLIQAMRYDGMEMPPDNRLPDTVINDFSQWIQDGAFDPRVNAPTSNHETTDNNKQSPKQGSQHWSFQPLTKPNIPRVHDSQWVKTSIDHFTLASMESEGVVPNRDAIPRTLLRRLHYDLTGLPPSLEEIKRFEHACQNDAEQAIQDVVNRLLASPDFGIRWGRHWLDIARFGESNGDDGLGRNASFPHAWRYRNYVIDTLNQDLPLDRFIVEQIAGDLLDYETATQRNRQLTATGFLAIGSKPASAMNKNFAMDIVDDQINVVSTGLTGLSVACARCHDHKHDPITTHDYYALAGIFTSTDTLYGAAGNEKLTAPPTALHQLTSKLPPKQTRDIDRSEPPLLPEAFRDEIEKLAPLSYSGLTEKPLDLEVRGEPQFDSSTFAKVNKTAFRKSFLETTTDYSISFWFNNQLNNDARPITAYLFSRAKWGEKSLPGDHLGIGGKHESARTGKLFVFNGNEAKESIAGSTIIPPNSWNHITFIRKANTITVFLNGRLEIEDQLPATFGASKDISISMRSDQFAPLEGFLGHVAIFEHALSDSQAINLHRISGQPRGPEPIQTLGLAMGVKDKTEPADCKIHINGESNKLGDVVPRGFPSVYRKNQTAKQAPTPVPEKQSGRLELAEWITSPQHPQTSRVLANRIWLHLFGKGLVETPNDFGVYGARPTHPELLDHLASELIRKEWSLKQLIKEIVLSRTYQLASRCDSETYKLDPENRWYTRHQRRRLDAESLRDSVLLASGNLDNSARDGSDVETKDILINWPLGESTNLHTKTTRRSIFLCMLRHAPPSELAAFDLPDGVKVVGQRETTNLPTQPLFLMNSDFILEQADSIAQQLGELSGATEKITETFARMLQRIPSPKELSDGAEFIALLDHQLSNEITDPERREHRIWASYAQALMSTNEFRYVD